MTIDEDLIALNFDGFLMDLLHLKGRLVTFCLMNNGSIRLRAMRALGVAVLSLGLLAATAAVTLAHPGHAVASNSRSIPMDELPELGTKGSLPKEAAHPGRDPAGGRPGR
jgi:hypothetical protein